MDKLELDHHLKQLQKNFEAQKIELYKKYANANNPYKIGDVVKDHVGHLRIEKIGYFISFGEACCSFTGVELKANGEPKIKQEGRTVYMSNVQP